MTPRKNASSTRPRRAVGYVRISKDRENETSTATQEQSIRAYVDAHPGWEMVEVVPEKGRSAYKSTRSSRKGLRKAMQMIEAGAADALVCWKLDRVARNTRDLLTLVDDLDARGAAFVSVSESFDTGTAMGRAMMTLVAALAELESAQKSERTSEWQGHRRAIGAVPTGPRPFGYQRIEGALVVDEDEAKVIRRAAEAVLAGQSMRSIVRGLSEEGVLSRSGKAISVRALRATLTGPTVAGCRELDEQFVRSEVWQPILDRATWDQVRLVLLDPQRRKNMTTSERRWLLPGLLACERDGTPMISRPHSSGITRYGCPKCYLSIGAKETEDVVARDVLTFLDRHTWQRLRARGRGPRVDVEEVQEQLDQLAQRLATGDLTMGEWDILRQGIKERIAAAEDEPVVLPAIDDVRSEWESLDLKTRRLIIDGVTQRITIRPARPGANYFDESRIKVELIA